MEGAAIDSEIGVVVGLVLMVGAAYISAHFVVDRLQRRFLVISGFEYLLLGVLLGPMVPQIHAFDDLASLIPVIALAAGWVGLLRGTDFDIAVLRRTDSGTVRIVLLHHLAPGLLVAFVAYYAFSTGLMGHIGHPESIICAAFLGCCAATDSSEPFEMLASRYEIVGKLSSTLKQATRMGDFLVIIVFGLIFCFFRGDPVDSTLTLSSAGWAWLMFGLGGVLGALFVPLLGGNESESNRLLALVGIIAFASGAAYFLKLSPLTVNLVLGIVVVNFARDGHLVHSTLVTTERPMGIVLMIFAGALWQPINWAPIVIGTAAFIIIRLVGKMVGSVLNGWGTSYRNDLFRGLMAHGDVTIAMAVSFRVVYDGVAADLAYSIVLGSVIFHSLIAPRALRGLLVDEGDVHHEIKSEQPA